MKYELPQYIKCGVVYLAFSFASLPESAKNEQSVAPSHLPPKNLKHFLPYAANMKLKAAWFPERSTAAPYQQEIDEILVANDTGNTNIQNYLINSFSPKAQVPWQIMDAGLIHIHNHDLVRI